MVKWCSLVGLAIGAVLLSSPSVAAQQPAGSIRGVVYDKDFEAPLPAARVVNVELSLQAETSALGNYVFPQVPPGSYTLVFSKDGYVRQVRTNVVVSAGQLTDVDAWLAGEFTEMEEFVVQDVLQLSAGSEAALIQLRFESPSLMDSIGADLMSRAGASDAASALKLVSGASIQDGKFAVIRGLPDRYVSSQMNGVRLPSADEDTRAVELDQFPSPVLESIRVSKTFTPDQQGDASGGAVDVRLKGIPEETVLQLKGQLGLNTQVDGSNFLSYEGGGLDYWGFDDGGRDVQFDKVGQNVNWDGAVGVSRVEEPVDYKWSLAAGGKRELDEDVRIGGFLSFFYERDSSFYDDGVNDSLWVLTPGDPLTPQYIQGTPDDGDFKTRLFDVTRASQSVQWGGLTTVGLETENHSLALTYLYTHSAEDKVTLAEDTRGKEYYFPGYDVDDPMSPGNLAANILSAPYIRTETLEYTERTTGTLQLSGRSQVGERVEVDWYAAQSSAKLEQPDKRQFGSLWHAPSFNQGFPPFLPPFTSPAIHLPFKPAANFTLGNLQRIWKSIREDSDQYAINAKVPYDGAAGEQGYVKVGLFSDAVERQYTQDTYSNFADPNGEFLGEFDEFWSAVFPDQDPAHVITASDFDVDYKGTQDIFAWYAMADVPLSSDWSLVGGARFETTDLQIRNDPDANATWYPPGATAPVSLNAGDPAADAEFSQDDVLPALGFVYEATDKLTVRGSYSQTIARQTFKELTPILQQEYLGAPIFIGNPDLQMSGLHNYDLRVDYEPYQGGLYSFSIFHKDIDDAIEYVQRIAAAFSYTFPVNYPRGDLSGVELEVRQDLGHHWDSLQGLSVGANATFIDGEVALPASEITDIEQTGIGTITTRDMTNAPEHLYNLYLTYDYERTGTELALFYTVQGDTLVAGAGVDNSRFVPSLYAKEYGTLNFSLSQKLGDHWKLQFQAKNLTDPLIEEVYRSEFVPGGDVTNTSYTKGIDYSISIGFTL